MPTPESSPPERPEPSLLSRWLRFSSAFVFLYVLYLVTPHFFNAIPALRDYDRVVQETGINPGALFYNDVPMAIEAQRRNRDNIRYFYHQPRQRQQNSDQ